MLPKSDQIAYEIIAPDQLDLIRPSWEKLRDHHAGLSQHFGGRRRAFTFDKRRGDLLDKSANGALQVEIARDQGTGQIVGYCVTSLSTDGEGEIDSLFVEESCRGRGVGSKLMRRALVWLDRRGAKSKVISVVEGNDPAIAFYAKFGFLPDSIILRQTTQ